MPLLEVNGTELHYELRGEGPSLLMIMGATGDGAVFDRVAELLAEEFTVVTFDRRGNGRSPRPEGWDATSPEEQANDAAALLDALGLAPAVVFGTSSAGIFALMMLIRHSRSVRAAILHDPALFAWFDDPEDSRQQLTAIVKEGMEKGGRPKAFEQFIRFVAGDENWERLDPSIQARMLASADTYFENEIGRFDTYLPADEELEAISAPVQVLASDGSSPEFAQAAGRLAERLDVDVVRTTGTHFPYLDHPEELVRTIRPFLRDVSA